MEQQRVQLAGPGLKGTVAHVDAQGLHVAELVLGRQGPKLRRWVHLPAESFSAGQHLPEPEILAGILAETLKANGFPLRLACLGLDDSITGVTLAELPDARSSVLSALIGRHVREELPNQNSNMVAHHTWLEGPPKRRSKKDDEGEEAVAPAFLAWVSEHYVSGLSREFAARGLKVERILPTSLALLDLLGHVLPTDELRIDVSVRFTWPSIVIGIYSGGRVRYARFLSNVLEGAQGDSVETGLTELTRTLSFVREKNRGRQPSLVTFSGLDQEQSERFAAAVEEQLGLPAETLAVDYELVGKAKRVDEGAPEEGQLLVSAALLHHPASRSTKADHPLDLSPPRPPKDRPMVAGLLALLLAGAGFCYQVLQDTEADSTALAAGLAPLQVSREALDLEAPRRSRELEQMRQAELWLQMLSVISPDQVNPAEKALQAVLLLPPTVSLKQAKVENSYGGRREISLSLQGDFVGTHSEKLRGLQQALQAQPWCDSIAVHRSSLTLKTDHNESVAQEDVRIEVALR